MEGYLLEAMYLSIGWSPMSEDKERGMQLSMIFKNKQILWIPAPHS